MYFIISVCWRRRRVEFKKKGKEKNQKTQTKIEKKRIKHGIILRKKSVKEKEE